MKTNLRHFVSIVGLLIPTTFITCLAIFIASNPNVLDFIEYGSLFAFNLDGLESRYLISVFCYFIVGVLMILFGFGFMRLLSKSTTNLVGSIIIIGIGVMWSSLSFFYQRHNSDMVVTYLIIVTICIIICSGLAQLLLSNDLNRLIKSKFIKNLVMFSGTLFILEFILCIYLPNIPIALPVISVFIYLLNIGIIAYYLSKDYDFIESEY